MSNQKVSHYMLANTAMHSYFHTLACSYILECLWQCTLTSTYSAFRAYALPA